jgi:dinuclear metal center YbgI/SA1388 family protein
MVTLDELEARLEALLEPGRYADYAPNGLQVEGRREVSRIVGGVTASLALIEAAVDAGADALLVHHGWFWKGEDARVRGIKQRRLRLLLQHGISLFAYHLPLDAHPELGNNAQLARVLDIRSEGVLATPRTGLVLHGTLSAPSTPERFARHIAARLGRVPLHIAGGPAAIRTVAWCTGAAQDYIDAAADAGIDAYISGEISERTTHCAREAGIHYFAAGHHATERYGVQALGEHLRAQCAIDFHFIDIDNPV